ncbi:hypothetical protein D8674_021231 [Pyrus ussuriensis x Pyrus communis]|uniref:Aminotransferase-like plant mobile domain-containing protein n=1 Tax=Pyrus ussuriensis x Pyrus communis TaxID=2448454 RepID=A0A5N5GIF2_9ROSA|nr:hypothetical protein D8674_021231 [Pyrus ussuriensis x Pyrus communis]
MAPKTTRLAYESGEGIVNICRLLNGLHRHRAGLNTSIFFKEGGVHALGPAWTSKAPIDVENNMPKANWFTPNPYSIERFSFIKDEACAQWVNELEPIFKKKWMNNGIYELIMLSKVTVITKPELLTTTLLFWNAQTNTFDFRMGPKLRPSSRCVDVTHDWSSSSHPTAKVGEHASSVGQSSVSTYSTFSPTLVVTPTSQFDPRTREMLHYVEDDSTSGSGEGSGQSHPPLIPIPWPKKKKIDATTSNPISRSLLPLSTELASTNSASGGGRVMLPPPLAFIPATASLSELVREFGQIKTSLRSPRLFREWMRRDITTYFSLKALHDAEKALIELYKAQ